MSDLASVYALFPTEVEARRIGRAMIERRLAACVNILPPCASLYRWEGRIVEGEEVPALFKTTRELAEALISAIADTHSYDVPAILSWPVDVRHPAYAAWVKAETLAPGDSMKIMG